MEQVGKDGFTWRQTLYEGMQYYNANKEYLANLLQHTSGHDSFIRHMSEINCRALRECILHSGKTDVMDTETEMFIRMYCMGTTALNCEWILGKYNVGPEQLARIHEEALPKPLYPYLY